MTIREDASQPRPAGAQAFADVARALQAQGTAQETLQRIVNLAPVIIDACEDAALTMVIDRRVTTPASTGPRAIAVDRIQYEADQGPCLDALRKHAVFVTDDLAAEDRWPDFARRASGETGVRSMLSFRLFVEDRTLGSLNLYSRSVAAFDAAATATGKVFAAHAALALSSARDRDEAQRLVGERSTSRASDADLRAQAAAARLIQRSMLSVLPTIGGLELAARYKPAVATSAVSGDWYDSIELVDGSIALAIGDVIGHDIDAAMRMAQLRNMLRALAVDRGGPASGILRRLDQLLMQLDVADGASCIYAVLNRLDSRDGPVRWRLRFANAGHPAPLLLDAGEGRFIETEDHLLMGVSYGAARSDIDMMLPAGSTLLLYTDGLIERRDQGPGEGMEQLRRLASRHASGSLGDLCGRVLADLASLSEDDCCVLAVRVPDDTRLQEGVHSDAGEGLGDRRLLRRRKSEEPSAGRRWLSRPGAQSADRPWCSPVAGDARSRHPSAAGRDPLVILASLVTDAETERRAEG